MGKSFAEYCSKGKGKNALNEKQDNTEIKKVSVSENLFFDHVVLDLVSSLRM